MKYLYSFVLSFCLVPLTAQIVTYTPPSTAGSASGNVVASVLSRGSGISAPGSPCSGNWFQAVNFGTGSGGSFLNNTSASEAFSDNDYWVFTITPNSGYQVTIASVTVSAARISSSGPSSLEWAYQIGSGSVIYQGSAGSPGTGLCSSAGNDFSWDIPDFSTTQAVTFYLTGYNSTHEGGLLRLGAITLSGSVSLPIELTAFHAKLAGNSVHLDFSTASERDNDYFSIERSSDGHSFSEIGRVKGAGDSNGPQYYIFTDDQPLPGKNYYRLKQVDFDGKYAYSPAVSVKISGASALSLMPSPVQDQLRMVLDKAAREDGQWQVFDLDGRLVRAGVFPAESDEYQADMSDLPEGAYVMRLSVGQEAMAKRFWKN